MTLNEVNRIQLEAEQAAWEAGQIINTLNKVPGYEGAKAKARDLLKVLTWVANDVQKLEVTNE